MKLTMKNDVIIRTTYPELLYLKVIEETKAVL